MIAAVVVATLAAPGVSAAKDAPAAAGEVRCPVMGNVVKDLASAPKSEYKGKTYYFCCSMCKPKFDADPEKYVGKGDATAPADSRHEGPDDSGAGHAHHHGH